MTSHLSSGLMSFTTILGREAKIGTAIAVARPGRVMDYGTVASIAKLRENTLYPLTKRDSYYRSQHDPIHYRACPAEHYEGGISYFFFGDSKYGIEMHAEYDVHRNVISRPREIKEFRRKWVADWQAVVVLDIGAEELYAQLLKVRKERDAAIEY